MSGVEDRVPITQADIAFARAVAAIARQHGVDRFELKFHGKSPDTWSEVTAHWSQGRHGASGKITLICNAKHECAEAEKHD
jgi:hypothetical protein